MKNLLAHWLHSVSKDAIPLHKSFQRNTSKAKEITLAALISALAAILQSAGGFLPVIGYLISPFATAPIILSTIYSIRVGFIAYLMTIVLLFIIEPSEIMIFPFTTGLLGLGIGVGLMYFKSRITVLILGSFSLYAGVIMLIHLFRFPVLGPSIGSSFSLLNFLCIYLFCLFYCWVWIEISRFCFKRLKI